MGTLNMGVTVLDQQCRALNLVWGLLESGRLPDESGEENRPFIAIVGGGFAGLTVAAALLKKNVDAEITIFEKHDTLLPLQEGSDSRWLHPHIYDWPRDGSESFSAALPVLNWTAARASDVVVQVLQEWKLLQEDRGEERKPRIYCNTRHLQIRMTGGQFEIEWIGAPRDPESPANAPLSKSGNQERLEGSTGEFSHVILAAGFGLEAESSNFYWRNEEFGQPQLKGAQCSYIVSGAGDGAMIDLFRLRIAQYRQDRILADLFKYSDNPRNDRLALLKRLRAIDKRCRQGGPVDLFKEFDKIWPSKPRLPGECAVDEQANEVRRDLQNRLRHDTRVVLHIRPSRFADLFQRGRVSFQNRLLAFLLFRVGGFQLSTEPLNTLQAEHSVPDDRVIRRHGTDPKSILRGILSRDLCSRLDEAIERGMLRQREDRKWGRGYFSYPGSGPPPSSDDNEYAYWRREYLPTPTQAIASSFCSAVAGYLDHDHSSADAWLRVTFHRRLLIGHEEVLQQCCKYYGTPVAARRDVVARTFEVNHAMPGVAYVKRRIYRTRKGAINSAICEDMEKLRLSESSRKMPTLVKSIVAIPVIGAAGSDGGLPPVIGILYVDSGRQSYFADSARIAVLVAMTRRFGEYLSSWAGTEAPRIRNNAFWHEEGISTHNLPVDPADLDTLEEVCDVDPPEVEGVGHINFDLCEFRRVEK